MFFAVITAKMTAYAVKSNSMGLLHLCVLALATAPFIIKIDVFLYFWLIYDDIGFST